MIQSVNVRTTPEINQYCRKEEMEKLCCELYLDKLTNFEGLISIWVTRGEMSRGQLWKRCHFVVQQTFVKNTKMEEEGGVEEHEAVNAIIKV